MVIAQCELISAPAGIRFPPARHVGRFALFLAG
jgi:hypothetical protein